MSKTVVLDPIKSAYCSIPFLAKRWGCSAHMIWSKVKSNKIPSYRMDGSNRIFIPSKWIIAEEEKGNAYE